MRVVEPLNVIKHVGLGFFFRRIDSSPYSLRLEGREEARHRRVVPDFASSAHPARNTLLSEQALELLAGVLAVIRVMQHFSGLAATPERHRQRVCYELRLHLLMLRPANRAAREQVDDGGKVQPTLLRSKGARM